MLGKSNGIKQGYTIVFILLILSGFGQMPIFKRYYIADIPGLGWLAQFYVTHLIHYMSAALMIALFFYTAADFMLNKTSQPRPTRTGAWGVGMAAGLIVSGGLMVIKNLDGIYWNHGFIVGLDLLHLIFCMILTGLTLYSLVCTKPWFKRTM